MSTKTAVFRFSLQRTLAFGQTLFVCGSLDQIGSWDTEKAVALKWHRGDDWIGEMKLPVTDTITQFEYKYFVQNNSTKERFWESRGNRSFEINLSKVIINPKKNVIHIQDNWQEPMETLDYVIDTAAFSQVVFRRPNPSSVPAFESVAKNEENSIIVSLEVNAWRVHPQDKLAIVGSIPQLGNWRVIDQVQGALEMADDGYPVWKANFIVSSQQLPIEYKYVVIRGNGLYPIWESGTNRVLSFHDLHMNDVEHSVRVVKIRESQPFQYNGKESFDWRGAGLAIPIFSLRSKKSLGIGEFADLPLLVDLAIKSGLNLVQILPINDTCVTMTWRDSYPYSSISVIALHPIYVHIPAVAPDMKDLIKEADKAAKELDQKDLKYEEVMKLKFAFLRKIFETKKQEYKSSKELAKFIDDNKWLRSYAFFCCLRDEFKTSNHFAWPKYNHVSSQELITLTSPSSQYYDDFLFYCFIQFHLAKQLTEATNYAKSKGIVLKADLPIGVDMASVDTWIYPQLFNLDTSTGAPPDYFAVDGQNWGFPTYNWEAMAADGYSWWRERLVQLDKYFTAIRIDHVLGFFRIWRLPSHAVSGMLGHFYPSIPIYRSELEESGIWDIDKLCHPYVTRDLLQQKFGEKTDEVTNKFFGDYGYGYYRYKPEYRTEKDLVAAAGNDDKLKQGLLYFIKNVCLIRDEQDPNNKFYPRLNLFQTPLYHSLPNEWKSALYRLHNSYFYERQEDLWRQIGFERLNLLRNFSTMLVCAEDLGLVAACVEEVLHELGILGLRIQRMPKDPKQDFDITWNYPYLTVCTPSTHDTSTLRGWWEENRGLVGAYYSRVLGLEGSPPHFCEPYVMRKIIDDHLKSKSMWSIIPLQDLFGMFSELRREIPSEEQINNPAERYWYWKYRIHFTLEELIEHEGFTGTLKNLVIQSGRRDLY